MHPPPLSVRLVVNPWILTATQGYTAGVEGVGGDTLTRTAFAERATASAASAALGSGWAACCCCRHPERAPVAAPVRYAVCPWVAAVTQDCGKQPVSKGGPSASRETLTHLLPGAGAVLGAARPRPRPRRLGRRVAFLQGLPLLRLDLAADQAPETLCATPVCLSELCLCKRGEAKVGPGRPGPPTNRWVVIVGGDCPQHTEIPAGDP